MSGTDESRFVKRWVESNQHDRSSSSYNASKALEIVLQQWLIPNMLWSAGSLEVRIPDLLEEIIRHEPGGELARSALRDRLTTSSWTTASEKDSEKQRIK